MKDFITAAFPWLIMGLSLAILCVKLGQKKEGEKIDSYMTEGMSFGLLIGTALGVIGNMSTGTTLSLGMLIGLTLGSLIPKKEKEE